MTPTPPTASPNSVSSGHPGLRYHSTRAPDWNNISKAGMENAAQAEWDEQQG